MRLHLTKKVIDTQAKPPAEGTTTKSGKPVLQSVYWDTEEKGFGLVVGRETKTFTFQADVRGQTIRVKIGRYGDMTPTEARKRAKALRVAIDEGRDPRDEMKTLDGLSTPEKPSHNSETAAADWQTVTVREAMETHLARMRKQGRAERSMSDFRAVLDRYLSPWFDRPLVSIETRQCEERHTEITEAHGPVVANQALRNLRACWRSTQRLHRELPMHPVGGVTFNPQRRKQDPIPWSRLPGYWSDVESLPSPIRRDLRHFILLTGLRSTDAKTLRWEEVNLTEREVEHPSGVTIPPYSLYRPKPKGGEERAFTAPLSGFVLEMLARRKLDNRMRFGDDKGWAFPTRDGRGKVTHVREVKEQRDLRDEEGKYLRSQSGHIRKEQVLPSPHRLRDTFATACHEAGIGAFDRKTLMNHRVPQEDVTDGYTRPSTEYLRDQVERVTAFLLSKAGVGAAERASA